MLSDSSIQIESVARTLTGCRSVCCLTGAGVSAESNVPTFRGAGGFWQGQPVESLATPQGFARDPARVWAFYHARREHLLSVQPNPGHQALVNLEKLFADFTLITQNVDRLHQLAGSENIIQLHGDIWTVRCTGCGQEFDEFGKKLAPVPICTECGQLLRPAVVWFGETLPEETLDKSQEALARCQVLLVVGTSAIVQPAASMPYWAKAAGAFVVEINSDPTSISSDVDISLRGSSGLILPQLAEKLQSKLFPN